MDGIEHFRWGPRRRLKVSWEHVEEEGEDLGFWPQPPSLTGKALPDLGRYLHQVVAAAYRVTEEQAHRSPSPLEEDLEVGQVREVFGAVLYDDHLRAFHIETAVLATLHLVEGRSRLLLRAAMLVGTPNLVTFHLGRPSTEPTAEDWRFLQTQENLATLNGLKVLDHLLVGQEGDWVSLRDWPLRDWPEPDPLLFQNPRPPMARNLPRSKRPRRFRDRFAGGSWTGQTSQRPAWLQEELEGGRRLEEFESDQAAVDRSPGGQPSRDAVQIQFLEALDAQVTAGDPLAALPAFLKGCREVLGLPRRTLHQLTGFSTPTLVRWEQGARPNRLNRQRLQVLVRWVDALLRQIDPEAVAGWVETPHPQMGGKTPLEVLEEGPAERLWQMAAWLEGYEGQTRLEQNL